MLMTVIATGLCAYLMGACLKRRIYLQGVAWGTFWLAGLLNCMAMLANGQHMPVKQPHGPIPISDTTHVEMTAQTRLAGLCDIHGPRWARYSLGDVFCAVGMGIWLVVLTQVVYRMLQGGR